MKDLQVEYVPIDEIKPYEHNAKIHTEEQIEQIALSITQFGFNDPVGIWHGEIVEGHGRYEAAKRLGLYTVPIIRLDSLSDEQRRAYTLVHNKLTMNTGFDLDVLNVELDGISDIDMSAFDFDLISVDDEDEKETTKPQEQKYTDLADKVQYIPSEKACGLAECYSTSKSDELVHKIKASNVSAEEKEFLICAAQRHNEFLYKKVADYYAHASAEMQNLMELSGLVIIDMGDAIKNGYVRLSKNLERLIDNDE